MDGTIVDTEKLWYQASATLFNRLLPDATAAQPWEYHAPYVKGLEITAACSYIQKATRSSLSLAELVTYKKELAQHLFTSDTVSVLPGFSHFHQELTKRNIKSAIATNAYDEVIYKTDSLVGLSKYFNEHMYGVSCVNHKGKPAPDIYLYAADKLGCAPAECLVLEDSAHGVAAGLAAGMTVIGITACSSAEIVAQADVIVNDYAELISRFDEILACALHKQMKPHAGIVADSLRG